LKPPLTSAWVSIQFKSRAGKKYVWRAAIVSMLVVALFRLALGEIRWARRGGTAARFVAYALLLTFGMGLVAICQLWTQKRALSQSTIGRHLKRLLGCLRWRAECQMVSVVVADTELVCAVVEIIHCVDDLCAVFHFRPQRIHLCGRFQADIELAR
jgi:hypothetical protein